MRANKFIETCADASQLGENSIGPHARFFHDPLHGVFVQAPAFLLRPRCELQHGSLGLGIVVAAVLQSHGVELVAQAKVDVQDGGAALAAVVTAIGRDWAVDLAVDQVALRVLGFLDVRLVVLAHASHCARIVVGQELGVGPLPPCHLVVSVPLGVLVVCSLE